MEKPQEYPINSFALLFPEMTPEELARLTDSIREHGQLEPIGVWRNEILDGRHRLAACAEVGIEPEFRHLPDDTDPLVYVLARNADRRHLDDSQRAVIAAKLSAGAGPGRPRSGGDNCVDLRNYSQSHAAKLLGVSRSMLTLANRVLAEDGPAVPELREKVERGQVRVSDAAQVLDQPPEVQRRAIALVTSGQAKNVSQAVRQVRLETEIEEETAQSEAYQTMPPGDRIMIHSVPVSDLRDLVGPDSVDAIITQPPHSEESLPLLADLADLAAHALRPTGVLVVVGQGMLLPGMLEYLAHPGLKWIGEFDLRFSAPQGTSGYPHYVSLQRRPLLVYGKALFRLDGGNDLIEVPAPDEKQPAQRPNEDAIRLVVERFVSPGQVVCDPVMLDRAWTALAAMRRNCVFIGNCAASTASIEGIRARLAAEESTDSDQLPTGSGDSGATDAGVRTSSEG